MNSPFLSLKYKNFRFFLFGMLISNIGTWMQNVAQPWLAYQITDNAFKISLVSALQFTPTLLLSLFAGAIIEHTDKKKMLFVTQIVLMMTTLMFAVLVFANVIQYWHILLLATLMGTANAFDRPLRQSMVIELVPKEDLMNAIALNSTGFNLARIIGPSFAGIILGLYGVGTCFLINSLSFLSVIISLFFVQLTHPQTTVEKVRFNRQYIKNILSDIKQGLLYLVKRKDLLAIIISLFFVSCFSMNHSVLLPVFVTKVLHLQETSYGFIMTCMGIGSFFGALLVASFSRKGPSRFHLTYGPIIVGLSLALIGFFSNYYMAAILYIVIGFLFVSFSSTANSVLQLMSDDAYRSRIISIYVLVFGGTTPLGNLFTGIIVDSFNASVGFIVNGLIIVVAMTLCTIIFAKHRHRKKGWIQ